MNPNRLQAWQADNGDGTFNNPVLYADYPDPDIVRVTNDFYMVSTTFADSPGINVLHSKDLANWEMVGHCCTNLDWSPLYNMVGGTAYRQGFWAGGIRYYNGMFYVVANPTGANGRIYYATNAAGPWQYYQLNQVTYDPSLLIDTNGAGYIVAGHGPESVFLLNSNCSQIIAVSNNVVNATGEGSHAVRVGNYYYVFTAYPGVWPFQLLCARSTNIFGPYETNQVVLNELTGGHQGGIVDLDNSGTNYYGFVMKDGGAIGRMTYICPVTWSNNWPVWGTNGTGVPATATKPVPGQAIAQPATSDDFTNATLGLQWQWNHNPDNTNWSLTARPGYLRLMPTQATNFWVARNTLTQKGQGPWSRGEIKLDASHLQPGDICGFGTLGLTNGQIAVNSDSGGNKFLTMNVIVPTDSSGVDVSQTSYGRVPVTGTNLYLRVDMDFNASLGTCSYSFDDTNWATLGGQFNLAYDISVSTFQGEKYAIFCYNPSPVSGYVDVDWFHFSDKMQRGRPHLNSAHTTFLADNGEALRGPFTSTEWTGAVPASDIVSMKSLGFNAIHLYAESFDPSYPTNGSTAPGYSVANVDAIVAETRSNGMYLVITIGNGANNGDYNLAWATNFWSFYAPRFANETHVIYEIHNEPVQWGPSYLTATTPPGALNMEETCYNIIRANAPNTPVLLFTYAVFSGTGGASAALKDIQAFNGAIFGNTNAIWANEAVAFHGYGGWQGTSQAVSSLISSGYPCMMTEFANGPWGTDIGGLDAELTSELERQNVSWLVFGHTPSSGVSFDISDPESYQDIVINSGLSWNPDYGDWPPARGTFGNGGQPWDTTTNWGNNFLTGTLHIEAENFDTGGEGVAYHFTNTVNSTLYRTNETVPIETTTDTSGGYDVTGTAADEWLEYTIWVQNPGFYNFALRYATPNNNCAVQALGYGRDKTGTWTLPATGSYSTWQTASQQVFLEWGRQKLHLNILNGGFNLNWMELSPATNGFIANGTYKFMNAANALMPTGVTSNSTIIASGYTGSTYQQWTLQHIGAGQYQVTCAANGWSLTGESGFYSWNSEHFIIEPTSGGCFRLQSTGGSCLETVAGNPTSINEVVYSGGANQQWVISSPSAPAFPTGLSALAVASTQISLTWNAATGASSYNVKRSATSGGPYTTVASGITGTNYTDTVAAGVQYYYVVSAVSGGVESVNSLEATLNLPYPWQSQDVGAVGISGSATCSNGVFTVTGSGSDIWGTADSLQFVYATVSGDCTLIARVVSVQNIDPWSKAGVMIRNSLDAGAANAFVAVTPGNGVTWQYRSSTNGSTANAVTGDLSAPYWVKLVRSGNTFTGYRSPDGTNWTQQGTATFTMSSTVYVGLAVTAHNNSSLCTAVFDNVMAPNWPPLAVPTGLSAVAVYWNQVSLTWSGLAGASCYNIKRSTTSGGPYTLIASSIITTNFTDTGVSVGTGYYYVVSAVVSGSESGNSPEAAVRFPKLTGGIIGTAGSWGGSGNTITNVFDNNLNTYFDAPSGNGDWVGLDFGLGVTNVITQINYCPRSSYESRMTNGVFQGANNTNFTGAVTLYTITNQPATGVFTSGVITNTTSFRYVRYLAPANSFGNVSELEFYGYQSFILTAVPSAPTGLAAAAVSSSQINLAWNIVTNSASYNVKRSTTNGGPYVIIATGLTAIDYNDTGLASATTYYYMASAVNAGGESTNSAQASATTLMSAPAAPVGLTVSAVSSRQINLTWNTVVTASSYNVKRSATNGGPYTIVAGGVTATNYPDSALAGGTIYYYVVSAANAGGESTNGAQATATTASGTLGSLLHRYSFSESGGASVADSVGGPVWNGTLPSGGTFSSGQLALSSNSQQYASLPAGIVNGLPNFTIMAWVNLTSTASWSRVFDFGNDTTTYMFLTPQCGGSGTLRFAVTTNSNGGEQQINCSLTLSTGAWHQVAVTLNTNRGILYLDGVAVGTNTSMTLNPAILGVTTNNYLGKSQWAADPYFNGLFDEFRIYNVGLSSAEIAATAALGSGGLLSTSSPPVSLTRTGTNVTVLWPLANAGFIVQSRSNLALGNWLNVTSPAPQITGSQWQMTLPQSTDSFNFYRLVK